ncbi:MAG: PKD domain-containing protein [Flavobacteriales bacterium]|nr:PKD domain-containing protein [Flavobacteriales bacterium]
MKKLFFILLITLIYFGKISAQCPTTAPNTTNGCNIGSGIVQLGANGSSGNYNWYSSLNGGSLLGSGAIFNTPLISSTTSYFAAATNTPSALILDGTNDYVALNMSYNTIGQISQITLEAWINTTESGTGVYDNWSIIDFDRSEYYNFFVTGDDGQVGFSTTNNSGTIHDFYSGSSNVVNDGAWHHIAAVYDGVDKIIYIDGIEVARSVNAHGGDNLGSGSTRFGFIGDGSEASSFNGSRNNNYYNGSVDEVRIWSTTRTPSEILNNINVCLSGGEANLSAYYNFNENSGTVLNDISGNGNTGTLFNFNTATAWIIGNNFSCPSCESSRSIATATINTAIYLGPDICSNSSSQILDAGTGYTSYLWNTGATSQTISVSTNGTYSVDVNDGSGCTGSDAINVTFVASPTGTGDCILGPGSIDLVASGSTGYYNWYAAASGGTPLSSDTIFTTPIISSTTTYYLSATDKASSLQFDGTNDYVALNMSYTNPGEIDELTVEAWINTSFSGSSYSDNWAIVDFDRSEYYNFYIRGDNGQVGFSTKANGGSIHDFSSGTSNSVNDGNWHHIAAVYDGTDKVIYIDGVEVARNINTHGGSNLGSGTNRFGFIGDGSEATTFNAGRNNIYFEGKIDNVRIWNTTRSGSEILTNKDACILNGENNLIAAYNFNESSGSTLNDVTGNGNNGTLFNMTSSAWIHGEPSACSLCESPRIPVIANIIGAGLTDKQLTCGTSSIILDAGTGFSSYLWSNGATSQTINVTQQDIYSVAATGGSGGCSVNDTVSVIGFTSSGNSLNFDGSNDKIAIENFNYTTAGLTELTVEAWVKTSTGGDQIIASFDRNQFWRLEINGTGAGTGQIGFDILTSAGQLDFGGTIRVDDGNWHHVAGVFDNGTVTIYIDGVVDVTTTTGSTYGTNTTRFGFVGIGSEASAFNGSTGPNSEYNGEMDEFRIWNVARTQNEIRSGMCAHIPGNETGLQVYYKFDELSGSTINDYNTSSIANGSMINFAGSAHIGSDVPLGDLSSYTYTNSWSGQTINLSSCDGDNVDLSNISGTPSGVHLYFVNNDPSIVTGILNYNSNNHYYGSFIANGTTPQHDIKWNYPGHNLVLASHETDLTMMTKLNNTASPWNLSSSIVNTTLQEINLTNQIASQFILDQYLISWTGATNTDWATGTNWNTGSIPTTGANIQVPNVTNQPTLDQNRTIGNLTINNSADINLNGFNLSLTGDFTNDGSVLANNGTISFIGTLNSQSIYANNNLSLFNITTNNTNGVSLLNGSIDLSGTLTLMNGLLSTNNAITLISDASGTARIAEITGGSITGNITMQRYINAGSTNWRFISSAITGATLADLNDDFETSGYPGSGFPNWPTAANPWPSIYSYDETQAGVQSNGFTAATNASNSMSPGQGFWVWSGDTITGTQPFTIDIDGPPNVGTINIPLSFTNSSNADDGWNMAGNPYPSTLDWDSPNITKTNINNAIYIWNPDNEQFASYVAGIGTNGGSSNIASSQAFWVQATSAGAAIQVTEASKTSTDGAFLKQASSIAPLRIKTENIYGNDELVINFESNATNSFDPLYDAEKIASSNVSLPKISSIINGFEYSINQISPQEISIPIKILTGVTATHLIRFENAYDFNSSSCLILEDLFSGIFYDLSLVDSFSTMIYDTTQTARFLLHIGAPIDIFSDNISCFGSTDSKIVYTKNNSTPFDIIWKDSLNNIIAANTAIIGSDSLMNLTAGTYFIETTDPLCGNNIDTVTITEPSQIVAQFSSDVDTVYLSNGGNVIFTNQSTNATSFNWNFGDLNTSSLVSPIHQYTQAGDYLVSLNANQSNDCYVSYSKTITVLSIITNIQNTTTSNSIKMWVDNNTLLILGEGITHVDVRNILGQVLFNSTNQNQNTFDLSALSSQVLIISVVDGNNLSSSKVNYIKK